MATTLTPRRTLHLKVGDTSPDLVATITGAGNAPVNLTGATVRFRMRDPVTNAIVVDSPATIDGSPSAGTVRYAWTALDTTREARTYDGEFVVTWTTSGRELRYPADTYLQIRLTGRIEPTMTEVATVEVGPDPFALLVGAQQQLLAVAFDENELAIPGVEFRWVSSNPLVASIDVNGLVTAIAPGVATFSAVVKTQNTVGQSVGTVTDPGFSAAAEEDVPVFRAGVWGPENPVASDRFGRDAGVARAGETGVTDVRYQEGDPRRHGALLAGANERAQLAAADTSAVARGGGIILPKGTLVVGSNITLASDLWFRMGARLKPLAGVVITILGAIHAARGQHLFDISAGGTISFAGNTRVLDVSVRMWGPVGDGVTDDTVPVQAFLTAVATSDVRQAVWHGTFAVTELNWVGAGTTQVSCNVTLNGIGSSLNPVFTLTDATGLYFNGRVRILGTGGGTYTSRTRGNGLKVVNSTRCKFEYLYVQFFLFRGIEVSGGNSTLSDLGNIRALDCGAYGSGTAKFSTTYSARTDTGSASSSSQRAVLTVGTLPDATYGLNSICQIGVHPHVITAINPATSEITVYPWPDLTLPLGTEVNYLIGAGVYIAGTDQGILNIEGIDAVRCGVGYRNQALYGGQVKRIVTQACGVGLTMGAPIASSSLYHSIIGPYFESNIFDILQISSAALSSNIISPAISDFSKCFALAPRSLTGAGVFSFFFERFSGVNIIRDVPLFPAGQRGQNGTGSTETVKMEPKPSSFQTFRLNSQIITLSAPESYNRLFGYTDVFIMALGSGTHDQPTGTWTFNPEAGYTVMGGPTYTFAGMTRPTLFHCYLLGTDWRITPFSSVERRAGSVSYNPPSLAAGAETETTVTVTGAALGDYAEASFSLDTQGITLHARVSAADTVTVRLRNGTAGTIDLLTGTLRASVRPAA